MPSPIRHTPRTAQKQPKYWLVYLLSVVTNLQAFLVAYSNSTYLEQYATPAVIGLLFTTGSCISILSFLFISRVLRKVGNTKFTLGISLLMLISLLVMGLAPSPALIIVFFVLYLITGPLLYMSLDVFSETLIGSDESDTGGRRGLTLSLMSLAGAIGPLLLALIVGDNDANLPRAYLASSVVGVLFITLVLVNFKDFHDPRYKEVKIMRTLSTFFAEPNMRNAFLTHLSLQVFFAWTVVYIPLYMATEIGFGWDMIGVITAVGLTAYILFEWPIGHLADNFWGEKEMMSIGFLILIVTLSWISFVSAATISAWMLLMFINRTGAALVEVTTESYFFKHTKGTDADLISFFRLTRPLGLVLGSIIGSAALLFMPFNYIFIVFACCLIPGMILTLTLNDTQ